MAAQIDEGRSRWRNAVDEVEAFRSWVEPKTQRVVTQDAWAIDCGPVVSELASRSTNSLRRHAGTYTPIWHGCDDREWRIDRYVDTTTK